MGFGGRNGFVQQAENEPQMDADFGLGFDYASDSRNTLSDNASDFPVTIDPKM